jgi:hypothetical protein
LLDPSSLLYSFNSITSAFVFFLLPSIFRSIYPHYKT